MELFGLKTEIYELRQKWQVVRRERLKRKQELINEKFPVQKIRHDYIYRQLLKQQRSLSVRMKHLEKKLNRMLARYAK